MKAGLQDVRTIQINRKVKGMKEVFIDLDCFVHRIITGVQREKSKTLLTISGCAKLMIVFMILLSDIFQLKAITAPAAAAILMSPLMISSYL